MIMNQLNGEQTGNKRVSLADLIVLTGNVDIEQAAKNAGRDLVVPFSPGRTDVTQEMTDADSFKVLEPKADALLNYQKSKFSVTAEEMMIDLAQLFTMIALEMTVILGGLRVLNINYGAIKHGVVTNRAETLSNDFFINLVDM